MYQFASIVFGLTILGFVPKLIFSIFHLLDDVSFLTKKGIHALSNSHQDTTLISRYEFISQIGLFIAGIPFISIIYGMTKGKYNFEVVRETIKLSKLPASLSGLKVVHISDLHLGSFANNYADVQKGINLINELNPDIVFFTGDLVNNYASETHGWEDVLSSIKSKYGKFSILGNHDYGDYVPWSSVEEKRKNLDEIILFHKKIGFNLLLNSNEPIHINGSTIRIVGVENWGLGGFAKYGNIETSLKNTQNDEFKILLSHDPSHWEAEVIPKSNIDLTLSGHTHGMQFGIRLGKFKYSPVQHRYKQWSGLYSQNEHYLYVNKGFGFIGFPGRVGMPPEITLLELVS